MSWIKNSTKPWVKEMVFRMQIKEYQQGGMLINEFDEIQSMVIILNGTAEVFTYIDGNMMVIDRLEPGTIINSRLLLIEDE